MTLTTAQLARAAALEARQVKFERLLRMNDRELWSVLGGDPVAAAEWVQGAAEQGVPAAQLRLGRMLLAGRGVPRDERAALAWFARAARQGDADAMNMVGRCHENGWGIAADLTLAAAHYHSSALRGHDWGEYNFGNMLFDGRGILRDQPQALRWYLRAARQGHGRAMNLLGRSLEEGWGCRRSLADAAYWYRRSAESGYFRGQLNYALLLLERGHPDDAAQWLWMAAVEGDERTRRVIDRALGGARDRKLHALAARIRALAAPAGDSLRPISAPHSPRAQPPRSRP